MADLRFNASLTFSLDARRDLPEHKIQSDPAFAGKDADASTGLTLALRPVPKFLGMHAPCSVPSSSGGI